MEYKEIKDFTKCERVSDIYIETSADYSLPDYNGDIRKILFTSAEVHPSGSFDEGESVDFSGIVTYNMVYSDAENRINSVSFSSDYDFSVKCNPENYESSAADISVASYAMRLLGPRKISAKATVGAGVIISTRVSAAPEGSAFMSGETPEVQYSEIDSFVSRRCDGLEREYAEEIVRLDGAIADEVSVIFADGECVIDSVSSDEGGVCVKGNLRVFALVQNGDEPAFISEKNIRVDESIPFADLKTENRLIPHVSVGSVRSSVNADENGCSVLANVIIDISCDCVGNERCKVVTDAYRRDVGTANSFENFEYSELLTSISEREEFSGSVSRESLEIDNLREILCLHALPRLERTEYEGGVITIFGEVRYSGLASSLDEDGKISYHPFKATAEFEKKVNSNCQNSENPRIYPTVSCYSASASVDENNVYISCMANIKLGICDESTVKLLSRCDVVEDGEFESVGARITVYYPEPGEKIFDIAKKFHTTVEKITETNSAAVRAMTGESSAKSEIQKLVIF